MTPYRREHTADLDHVAGRWLNLIALLAVLAVNVLANLLPLNGHTTGELASRFHDPFRPADYTFGIWLLIYAGLLGFVVFQLLPKQRSSSRIHAITGPFLWSCAANIAWLFCWHYQVITMALIAMVVLLVSLIVINQRLHWGTGEQPVAELWCVEAPFRVYLAWISVAFLTSVSTWVEARSLLPAGLAPESFAIGLVLLATTVSGLVGWLRHDALYLAVIVWAFVGIAIRNGASSAVSGVAMAGVLICCAVLLRALFWNRRHGATPPFHSAGTAT